MFEPNIDKFSNLALRQSSLLLKAYRNNNNTVLLDKRIRLRMLETNGNAVLVDKDDRYAGLHPDGSLQDIVTLPKSGLTGFASDLNKPGLHPDDRTFMDEYLIQLNQKENQDRDDADIDIGNVRIEDGQVKIDVSIGNVKGTVNVSKAKIDELGGEV